MERYILLNKFLVVLIDASSLWLGFRVYHSNKNKLGKNFLLATLSIVGWISAGYLCNFLSSLKLACFFCKLNIFFVGSFFISVYLFVLLFPKKKEHSYELKWTLIISTLFVSFLSLLDGFVIKGIRKGLLGNAIATTPFLKLVYLFFFFFTIAIVYYLFKGYKDLTREERKGISYFLAGTFLFALFNIIFNIIFPLLENTMRYYQLGDYSAILFLLMISLGIVRGELFGVRAILTELFIVFLGAVLLSQVFIFNQGWEIIWDISVFFLFLLSAVISIKAIRREIQQREELENSYKTIEKLNRNLDRKVRERTKELEEKIEELNKFYRLTIGREMKMIELKKKIEELEKKQKIDK